MFGVQRRQESTRDQRSETSQIMLSVLEYSFRPICLLLSTIRTNAKARVEHGRQKRSVLAIFQSLIYLQICWVFRTFKRILKTELFYIALTMNVNIRPVSILLPVAVYDVWKTDSFKNRYCSSSATFLTSVYILRTDRLTDLAFWKISSGHIWATGHPIQFVFGSRVKVSVKIMREE